MICPRQLGTLGVDPTLCRKIQCGLITQSQAGYDLLLACSRAGYAGVRTAFDPVCQELAGGGPVAVVEQGTAAAQSDPLPDDIRFYDPAPDGSPANWFDLPAGPSIDNSAPLTASAASSQPDPLDPTPPADQTQPESTPTTESQANTTPEPDTALDPEQYAQLIGDPSLRFSPARIAQQLSEWLALAGDAAKEIPWWVWLIAAGVGYELLNKRGRR